MSRFWSDWTCLGFVISSHGQRVTNDDNEITKECNREPTCIGVCVRENNRSDCIDYSPDGKMTLSVECLPSDREHC